MEYHESILRVHQPPSRPTLIYDGNCRFCRCQVERWKRKTGSAVAYVASNTPEVRHRFAGIPQERFERSLQFVTTDGWVYAGAHGVLKALTIVGKGHWLLRLYEGSRLASGCLEFGYRAVADNRGLLSRLSLCARRLKQP